MSHKLRVKREEYGWTLSELAEVSGIHRQTVSAIESGSKLFHTHFTTAELLAWALDCEVDDIFQPEELSGTGRPACTGKQFSKHIGGLAEMTCWSCHLVVRKDAVCNFCGANQTLSLAG